MKTYTVDEVFELLKENKITSNIESVRRWLRNGTIKGIAPASKKEGWRVPENMLNEFIQERLPESYATNVAKGETREQIREEMWKELARKNIWEGYVELKKSRIHECIQHWRYSKDLEVKVWERCIANSREYKKPRVSFLLEAFKFEGKRLLLDKNFEDLEEQVIFSIIEYVRKHPIN